MINFYTRIASFVLAFGFFFGCSVIQGISDNTSHQQNDNLSAEQREQRIAAIDQQLQSDRYNPDLYFKKGTLLTNWAQNEEEPAQRTPLYSKAATALQKADSLSQARGGTISTDSIRYLQRKTWSSEHNQGIQYMQNAASANEYQQAAIYFDNAAAIMPDSTSSYQMASQLYYQAGELQKAIDVFERARRHINPLPLDVIESLAYLYMETEQFPEAINTYQQARSQLSHSFNLMHGLSNAYIKAEDHQNAIRLLQQLSSRKPGNLNYRHSLASEFYKAGRKQILTIVDNLEQDRPFSTTALATADSLFDQAESYYSYILERQPQNADFTYEVAQFYQNKAAQYQRLLPHLYAQKKKEITGSIEQNISAAIPLLKQLTEQKPANRQLWEFLYRTYSYLGMEEEARQAKSNF